MQYACLVVSKACVHIVKALFSTEIHSQDVVRVINNINPNFKTKTRKSRFFNRYYFPNCHKINHGRQTFLVADITLSCRDLDQFEPNLFPLVSFSSDKSLDIQRIDSNLD